MKTLTDLLNLITREIEISQDKMVSFEFVIDTRYNWLTFEKVSPEVKDDELTGNNNREKILNSFNFDTPEKIQQAYWTIYNEGRYKYTK